MRTIIITCLLLCGCAETTWKSTNGASQQDFARDMSECLVQANQAAPFGGGLDTIAIKFQVRNLCMNGRGYHITSGF